MSDLNRDQLDVLEVALDVVIAAAKSDAAPYFDEKGLGFLAALEGMDPPLTVVPLTPATSDGSLDVAWREAEEALGDPDGRKGWDLTLRALTFDGSGSYVATANRIDFVTGNLLDQYESPIEIDPATALRALATRLTELEQ